MQNEVKKMLTQSNLELWANCLTDMRYEARQAKADPKKLALELYATRAVQLHRHGGQSDFAWPTARAPHGGASYVW